MTSSCDSILSRVPSNYLPGIESLAPTRESLWDFRLRPGDICSDGFFFRYAETVGEASVVFYEGTG